MSQFPIIVPDTQFTINITLSDTTSMATSSLLIAGRHSDVITNPSNKYVDWIVSGRVKTNTAPQAGTGCSLFVYTQENDTPTYPSPLTGLDSAGLITFGSIDERAAACRYTNSTAVFTATAARTFYFPAFSVASLFYGLPIKRWGIFASQNGTVAMSATPADFELVCTPYYIQVN